MTYEFDIIICYAFTDNKPKQSLGHDKGWVDFIRMGIREYLNHYVKLDEWKVTYCAPGEEPNISSRETVKNKISKSKTILFILTPMYAESDWLEIELKYFLERGCKAKGKVFILEACPREKFSEKISKYFSGYVKENELSATKFWYYDDKNGDDNRIGDPEPSCDSEQWRDTIKPIAKMIAVQLKNNESIKDNEPKENNESIKAYFFGSEVDHTFMKNAAEELNNDEQLKLKCILPLTLREKEDESTPQLCPKCGTPLKDTLPDKKRMDIIKNTLECDFVVMFYFDGQEKQLNDFYKNSDYTRYKSKRESQLKEVLIMREGESPPAKIYKTKLYKLLLTDGSYEDCVKKLRELLQ